MSSFVTEDYFDQRGDPGWHGVPKFSRQWRELHRTWWLNRYPDCDENSRRSLDYFVEMAS